MNGWMKKWLAGAAVAAAILATTAAANASPPHHHGGYHPTPHGTHYHSNGYRGPHANYGHGRYDDRRYDDRRYDDRRHDRDCDPRTGRPTSTGYRGPAVRPLPPPNHHYHAPSNSSAFGVFGRNFGIIYRN